MVAALINLGAGLAGHTHRSLGHLRVLLRIMRNIGNSGRKLLHGAGLLSGTLRQSLRAVGNLVGARGNLVGRLSNLGQGVAQAGVDFLDSPQHRL